MKHPNTNSRARARARASIILTCEHGGHKIPTPLAHRFKGRKKILASERGWDFCALKVAKILSQHLHAPLVFSEISRLAVDFNRSLTHPKLHSEFAQNLSPNEKQLLLNQHYLPYREKTHKLIQPRANKKQPTHHFSIHSFAAILHGEVRNCEIGILYDPRRKPEANLAKKLRSTLHTEFPEIRIRMNYPYRGASDGHTTALRKSFSPQMYTGIEIELNIAWLKQQIKRKELQNTSAKIAKAILAAVEA